MDEESQARADERPTGPRIKESPEDFIVEEVIDVGHEKDDHVVFTLMKTNWDTLMAVKVMARRLGVSQKRFGFAGLKDKVARTSQKMSVRGVEGERLASLRIPRLAISDIERGDGIRIGDLRGNRFTITLRDVERDIDARRIERGFPNYFGIQRFGEARPVTHLVGKLLLEGKLEEAAFVFITMPVEGEKYYNVRKKLYDDHDYPHARISYPKSLPYERAMLERIDKGALHAFKGLPKRLNTLFIHAAQAHIFNKVLFRRCEEVPPHVAEIDDVVVSGHFGERAYMRVGSHNVERVNEKIPSLLPVAPIVGYKTRLYGRMKRITEEVLEEEGLRLDQFEMKAFPALASRGTWREMLGITTEFSFARVGEVLTLRFYLPKGCYATTLLDCLFGRKPFM